MKNSSKLLLFALSCLLFLSACKKNSPGTQDLSGTYTAKLTKSVKINSKGLPVSLTFVSARDNRCPSNADCMDAGSAVVSVRIQGHNFDQTMDLCLGNCYALAPTFMYGGTTYYIALEQLLPYPEIPAKVDLPKTATIKITKQ